MRDLKASGFRPELLRCVDERVMFMPLSMASCRQIVDALLRRELAKFAEKGVQIVVPDDVRDILAKLVFDRSLDEGARGARRVIEMHIISPAVDIFCECQDRNARLPRRLVAVAFGCGGRAADGRVNILLEVEL